MTITARQPSETAAVAVAPAGGLPLPEPGAVFALFPSAQGARYFDDPALGVRSFNLPQENIRLTFERMRVRVEDTAARRAEDLHLGEQLGAVAGLYPKGVFSRYGFNYDVVYRYDQVIPTRGILGAFLRDELVEQVSHFGWQCTIAREKGKRRDTHFFKVISPLELQMLANVELDRPLPEAAVLQKELLRYAQESQKILDGLPFN